MSKHQGDSPSYHKGDIPNWILTVKEEAVLSWGDKRKYYEKLRNYCMMRKLTNTTPGAINVAPKLKKITGKICKKVCRLLAGGNVEVITDGLENIPEGPVIFASTHQGILDNFVWITDCPQHSIIFHGAETNKALLAAQINTGLILVTKDKDNMKHRTNAKLDMMSVLMKGHSVYICPETAWNLSPNRLHLPINYGFIDSAQKIGVPIVPMVIEYTYDSTSIKERISKVHIRYGQAILVGERDSLVDKLEEYKERISTIRWELIEEKGMFSRSKITNNEYINFVKGNLKNLKLGKIDINRERAGIYGANSEFYVFQHINEVPWDAWGNLLQTDEWERLKRINRIYGI